MKRTLFTHLWAQLVRRVKANSLLWLIGILALCLSSICVYLGFRAGLTVFFELSYYAFAIAIFAISYAWIVAYIENPPQAIKWAGRMTAGCALVIVYAVAAQLFYFAGYPIWKLPSSIIALSLIITAFALIAVANGLRQIERRDAAFRWSLITAHVIAAVSFLLSAGVGVTNPRWLVAAVGSHALQVLPGIGWLLTLRQIKKAFINRGRILFVFAAGVGFFGTIVSLAMLGVNPQVILSLTAGASLILLTAGILTGRRTRSGQNWNLDIASLRVESNPDYRPRDETTYCNVYAADLVNMQHGYGPPYRQHLSNSYPLPLQLSDGTWLDANRMIQWLRGDLKDAGPDAQQRGWRATTLEDAIAYAEQGCPTIVTWESPDESEPGHMAVVRAGNSTNSALRELQIAQASSHNFTSGSLKAGFGDRDPIEFYVLLTGL